MRPPFDAIINVARHGVFVKIKNFCFAFFFDDVWLGGYIKRGGYRPCFCGEVGGGARV